MQEIKKINLSLDIVTFKSAPIEIIDGDRGKNYPKQDEFTDEGYCLFLNAKNVTENGFNFDTKMFISEEKDNLLRKGKLQKGDVILTTRGTVGNVAFYSEHIPYNNIRINSGMLILRPKQELDNEFLYWTLKSNYFKKQIYTFQSGTAQPQLPISSLKHIEFYLPPINIQKKIVKILSQIDNKIRILKYINKNLQEQIETIYNSFFVYYDDFLKEELEECEIGFIPKDWNLMTLGQITTQIKEKVGKNNYKVFSAVNTGNLILSEEYFDKQVFSKSIEKYIVVKQDEFAYNPARINIGSIGRNDFDYEGCVSPVYVAFKVEEGYENFMNMFIKSKRFNQWVITLSSGSVRQTLNYNDFSIIKIAYPPKSLVNKFNVIYESYYEVINYNKSVIHNLEEIRDTLLPKLMSGEIDVSKINCDLELKYNYMKYLFNQIHTPMSKSVV